MIEPNPLNLYDLRQVPHCPPHFYVVDFDISVGTKQISDWIFLNLAGRFYLGDVYKPEDSRIQKRAGFEIPGEGSYFALCLHDINKKIGYLNT